MWMQHLAPRDKSSAKGLLAATVLLVFGGCANQATVDSMRKFLPTTVLGWSLQDSVEIYDRETIFDYIDGAGEVYRAYDFRTVELFRYQQRDKPALTAEIFDMGSAEDAYGVFSHSREIEESGIGEGYERRGGLLCFWKAAYFICLTTEVVTDEAENAVLALAREIDNRLPASGTKPRLLSCMPDIGLIRNSIRFFHTQPMLNYHYYLSEENLLNLTHQTSAVLALYEPGPTHCLCIRYSTPELAEEGHRRFLEGYIPEADQSGLTQIEQGRWVKIALEHEYVVLILDALTGDQADNLAESVRNRIRANKIMGESNS